MDPDDEKKQKENLPRNDERIFVIICPSVGEYQELSAQNPRDLAELDDLASLETLRAELTDYIERTDSSLIGLEVYPGTERLDYDFTLERQNIYSTNILESMSHLVKGCLGAGILSMHEGYMRGGIWASLGVTAVIGVMVPYSMYMLVSSAQKLYVRLRVPRLTYPDLVEAAVATGPLKCCRKYSKAFRYSIDICLVIELYGTCCIYEIMIASTLKQVLEAVSETVEDWNLSIRIYIIFVMLPLFLLCLIRNLKYLATFCLVADLFVAICILTAMYYSISQAGSLGERPAFKSFKGLIQFCGVLLYSIDGVFITLPVENNMKKPQYFPVVLQFGMGIVVTSVTMTGFFGYWGWGETCKSPITIHMPLKTFPIILQFLMSIFLAVTFAINFWVPFRIIWHYIGRKILRNRGNWERLFRGIHVILITGLSLLYPNLIKLMIFLGNFFLAFIAFVFPAIVESLVTWREPRRRKIRWCFLKNIFLIIFGIMLSASAFYA